VENALTVIGLASDIVAMAAAGLVVIVVRYRHNRHR
jgi:hypothetical protein